MIPLIILDTIDGGSSRDGKPTVTMLSEPEPAEPKAVLDQAAEGSTGER